MVRKGGPAQSASKGTEALVRNASWVVPGLVHVFRNTHAAAMLGCLDPEQGHWTGTLGRTRWQMLAAVTDAVWPPDAPDPSDMSFPELQRLWRDSSFGSLRSLQVALFSVMLVQLPMLPAMHRVIRSLHPSAEDAHPLANLSAQAVASGSLGLRHGAPLTMLSVVSPAGEQQQQQQRQNMPKKQPKKGGKGKSVEAAVRRLYEAPPDDRSAWASYSSAFVVSMWTLRLGLQRSFVSLQAVGARESEQAAKERTAAGLARAVAGVLPSLAKGSHKKKRTHQEHLQQEREELEIFTQMDSVFSSFSPRSG